MQGLAMAGAATGFTFLMTAVGAEVTFLFRREAGACCQRALLGFAAGVMLAASVWSLLLPAMEMTEEQGKIAWIPAVAGTAAGALFLLALDGLLARLRPGGRADANAAEGGKRRTAMLIFAVTLHNLPEGMAVGLACALAASGAGGVTVSAAAALTLGIGLQNFPEGAAVALPLRQQGYSRTRSFACGALSGLVEPVGGLTAVWLAGSVTSLLPWLLCFAAGAMLYVVAQELIPEAQPPEAKGYTGTLGVLLGFLLMMGMDVALG